MQASCADPGPGSVWRWRWWPPLARSRIPRQREVTRVQALAAAPAQLPPRGLQQLPSDPVGQRLAGVLGRRADQFVLLGGEPDMDLRGVPAAFLAHRRIVYPQGRQVKSRICAGPLDFCIPKGYTAGMSSREHETAPAGVGAPTGAYLRAACATRDGNPIVARGWSGLEAGHEVREVRV